MPAPISEHDKWTALARKAASNKAQCKIRKRLAKFTAATFTKTGEELYAIGYTCGGDRVAGMSPFNYGSDEVVAVSLLLRLAGELTSAIVDLFEDGRHYAAGALLRQMVEIEYLAWAFESRDKDAERWLRSDKKQRVDFFSPKKLREAAKGKFRGKDYGFHCELGGHPVPTSSILLRGDEAIRELLLSDLLGHTGRIWDYLLDWAAGNDWSTPMQFRRKEMSDQYKKWKETDELTLLPPPV